MKHERRRQAPLRLCGGFELARLQTNPEAIRLGTALHAAHGGNCSSKSEKFRAARKLTARVNAAFRGMHT
jgi:hypothetical protein